MDKNEQLGIILIHGAGLKDSIWRDVVNQLDFPYILVDYSQLHEGEDRQQLKLDDYVTRAYNQALELNTTKVFVVGHSIGGLVGIEVVKRLGGRAAGFLGISAAIPKPGNNFVSCLPFPQKFIMQLVLKFVGTKPPESAIRQGLCSDLNEEQTHDIMNNFCEESTRLYLDKISNDTMPLLPFYYIKTKNDKEFGVRTQDKMIQRLPRVKVYELNSGHMPMLSHPQRIVNYILTAIKQL